MIKTIKNLIKLSFLYDIIKTYQQKRELRNWEKKGRPNPPPHLVKQETIKEYAKKFSLDTFIETGTYLGDMICAVKNIFGKIISIELDEALYKRAKKKFSKFSHISIIQGDSANILPRILADIIQPCLFWLDGHYSGGITAKGKLETPIIEELQYILHHSQSKNLEHVILIDDARCFQGKSDFPTIEETKELVFKTDPNWIFEVKNDIIRIYKKQYNI